MTKKRELMFSIVRGLLAILIALLVATLLIFISANGESVSKTSRPPATHSSRCWSVRCSAWAKTARALKPSA